MNREKLSIEIIETCLEMNAIGLNQGTAGNISVRYKDGMLITPSGIAYKELTCDQIVYITNDEVIEQGKNPSSEWHFHLACYKARPELNAVLHNHAINATCIAILNKPIPAIHYMVAVSGIDHIPCIGYETFGSIELSNKVCEGIKNSKAILMEHHGMIAMEVNLKKALWLALEIEILATQYLKLLSVRGAELTEVPVLSSKEMDKVIEKFKNYGLKT